MLSLIAPNAPRAKTGRPPFELVILQQWVGLSDLAMEEALFETALYRQFAGLSSVERIPDQVSILRFRHLLEERQLAPQILAVVNATLADKGLMLKQGTVVDATLIAAPSSTKNQDGERDPERLCRISARPVTMGHGHTASPTGKLELAPRDQTAAFSVGGHAGVRALVRSLPAEPT